MFKQKHSQFLLNTNTHEVSFFFRELAKEFAQGSPNDLVVFRFTCDYRELLIFFNKNKSKRGSLFSNLSHGFYNMTLLMIMNNYRVFI